MSLTPQHLTAQDLLDAGTELAPSSSPNARRLSTLLLVEGLRASDPTFGAAFDAAVASADVDSDASDAFFADVTAKIASINATKTRLDEIAGPDGKVALQAIIDRASSATT